MKRWFTRNEGKALPGFALDDCVPIYGDDIARVVKWKGGDAVIAFAGKPVSPVGAHAWLIGEPGIVQCIELATGKDLWKERIRASRVTTWSSLVRSGDRIYAVTQGSDVVAFRTSTEKYEQIAVNSLGDGLTNSSLAISDGQIFLRTHKHLWCIGK